MTAFQEALREAAEEARRADRETFGPGLVWLALVPEWTEPVADACEFPCGDDLHGWVARAEAAGLCESRTELGPDAREQLAFLMPQVARAGVVAGAGADATLLAARLGGRIAKLPDRLVPSTLRRWAQLAVAAGYTQGDQLSGHVSAAVAARDTAAVVDWIAAGEALTPVFGGELASAVARAKRRLNLIYRAQQDERLLAGFVRRADQIAAVERLLTGPDEEWALHLIGLGGAGKTMLVRYIATVLARERGLGRLVTARVDFDYIPPSFPFERPAELLVRLCDGLAQHVEDQAQESLLERFVREKRAADDAVGRPAGDPRERIMQPPLQSVLDAFADFVGSLGGRVLLMLDTCEELAKLHAGEESVPSVEAMWLLLTETRRRVPGVRVLLAGRRLLAAADADGPYEAAPGSIASFAERPYLRTFEIRGFRRDEAEQLLGRAGATDAALVDAILANAREVGRSPGVRGGGEGPARDRYNPFDLKLYADWLRANPHLRAEDVSRAEADAYTQARIVDRLHDAGVDAALPAIARLRRFDLDLLAATVPAGLDARRVLAVLGEQEWVDLSGGHTPETVIVDVEPHLLPRLERYCARQRPEAWTDAAARAAARAGERLRDGPLDPLGLECADLALRLAGPAEAAASWARLERRIVVQGEWEWAIAACERLLADEEDPRTGEARPRHERVRAHLLATLLSALHHRTPTAPVDERWELVLEWADRHPVLLVRDWLFLRAGAVAYGELPEPDHEQTYTRERLDAWQREQLIAAGLAALERRSDERPEEPLAEPARRWLQIHGPASGVPLGVAARMLLYDAAADDEAWLELLSRARAAPPAGGWLDWVPPASLRDRVALEWALALVDADRPVPALEAELQHLVADPLTVDGERLASLLILQRLAHGEPAPPALGPLLDRAGETLYAPACLAHRRVPPLFVAVARSLLMDGEAGRALQLLRALRRAYESARGADPVRADAARAARREIVAVLRRMRIDDPVVLGGPPPGADAEELAELAEAEVLVRGTPSRHAAAAGRLPLDYEESRADERRVRQLREREAAGRTGAPVLAREWARLLVRGGAFGEPAWTAAARGIPVRRLAELELEEGELLALRLPGEACRLLAAARDDFARARDPGGELIAAIAWAGAAMRAGDLADGRRILAAHVRPAYERLGRRTPLPPWDAPPQEPVGDWQGWLLRLSAYRRWAARDLRAFGATPELIPPPVESDAPPAIPAQAPAPPAPRRRRPRGPLLLAAILALVLLVASLLQGAGVAAVITTLILPAVGLLAATATERLGWTGAMYRLAIDIAEAGPRDAVAVRVRQTVRGFGRLPLRRLDQIVPLATTGRGGAHEQVQKFVAGRMGSGRANPVVALRVSPALQAYSWEAELMAFAADKPWRSGWAPDVARELPAGDRPAGPLPECVAVLAPERWARLAGEPWRSTDAVDRPEDLERVAPVRVALLVGAGVETASGARLRLDLERLTTVSEVAVSAAAEADEALVDPEAVVAAGLEVVIVLGAPGPLDPASSAPLRAFGAAVAAGGARVVVVIPTLPPDVAAAALAPVAGGWPFGARSARRAARAARALVYAQLEDLRDARSAAAALDLCLFLRPGR